jgi:NADPH2:quinone reductase
MTIRVVATAFGGPEVLTVVDDELADPGPGEVRIDVAAIGTNPIDVKRFGGMFGTDASQLPMPLGSELAGVVTAVGQNAHGPAGPIAIGDEVIAYPIAGAYATQVVAPGSSVLPKPSTLSFEQASGLMVGGTTAVHALAVVGVSAGDTVVIHAAAGGVGQMAVQLAVGTGARVIGTASPASHDDLRALGAEPVAYGDGLLDRIVALAPEGVDAALDLIGSDEALDVSVALVSDRSRIVTIAGFQRGFELGIKVVGGSPGADPGTEIRGAARLELVRQAKAGRLTVRVARTFPLAEAAEALGELATGHAHGKIVLIP